MRCFPLNPFIRTALGLMLALGVTVSLGAADLSAPIPDSPSPISPIVFFRALMSMTPEQQQAALAGKTDNQREVLRMKIREYSSMPKGERDLRLRLLEMRLYLVPLMRMDPTNRNSLLVRIPTRERFFVESRLKDWNQLGDVQQMQILRSRASLHLFLYRGYGGAGVDAGTIGKITPPNQDAYRERMIARWQGLSEERRHAIVYGFDTFLALEKTKKHEVLQKLPIPDQAHAQSTLRKLESLSPDERVQFLNGLRKFADMDFIARKRFQMQVQRWISMSSEERSLWRSIIVKVQTPPPPPGLSK